MKKIAISILLLFNLAYASEYVIISNKNAKELSEAKIRAIFLKKLSYIGETKIIPLNLQARDPLRTKFEKEVLHMSFSRLKTYWTKLHYLGHRPPISLKSQKSIISFVKRVDGAIGYIDAKNIDDSVKIIYRWSD